MGNPTLTTTRHSCTAPVEVVRALVVAAAVATFAWVFVSLVVGSGLAAAQVTPTLTGTVTWTDRELRAHPAANIEVVVSQDNGTSSTHVTDPLGRWSSAVTPGLPVTISVRTIGEHARVGTPESGGVVAYTFEQVVAGITTDTEVETVVADAGIVGGAVSVHQALSLSGGYIDFFDSDLVTAVFPPPAELASVTAYFPDDDLIVIAEDDPYDWDVITHEHGHAVAVRNGFSAVPADGFLHQRVFGDNLSESLGLTTGQELAWSEGWATFFAVWSQQRASGMTLGITDVGDTSYTDRGPTGATEIDFDMNSTAQAQQFLHAADNEVTVARALWLLFNSAPSREPQMLTALKGSSVQTLAEAATLLRPTVVGDTVDCQFAEAGYLPQLISPVSSASLGVGIPAFSWRNGGTGPDNAPESFTIRFVTNAGAPLFEADVPPNATGANTITTFRPTASDWARIRTFGLARWSVEIDDGSACSRPFSVVAPLEVTSSTSCLFGRGVIRVAIEGQSTTAQTIDIVASNSATRLRPRTIIVQPGATVATAVTGRPDGPWRIEAFDSNGERIYNQTELINCAEPADEVEVKDWCFAGNGRVDVSLSNETAVSLTYFVEVDGVTPRFALVNPGESRTVSVTGRPDGSRLVQVFRNSEPLQPGQVGGQRELIHDQRVSIACDVRANGELIVLNVRCVGNAGRVDVYAFNSTAAVVTMEVALQNTILDPRLLNVDAWSSDLVTWTGRPNGDTLVTVRSGGVIVFSEQVAVAC